MFKFALRFSALTLSSALYVLPAMADPAEGLDNRALDNLIKKVSSVENKSTPNIISQRNSDQAGDLIMNAMGLLGVAYRFGGNSPVTGLDCSGFMQYIFKHSMNITLPRTSRMMATVGTPVSRDDLRPGDLVFFSTHGRAISHVGMYIGKGRMIHAPRTGRNIEITSIDGGYWSKRYVTARRMNK